MVDTPYRQPLPVKAWLLGNPERKSLAVMGALRGNEIQQMYICGKLIQALERLERQNLLDADCDGQVFFAHKTQLIAGHEVVFLVLPCGHNEE